MALKFHVETNGGDMKMHTLAVRTFVTLDGKRLMGPKDSEGKLLGPEGSQIPLELAVALGLAQPVNPVEPAKQAEAKEHAPAEDKAHAPAAKKGRK
jgi:hypothetical protein